MLVDIKFDKDNQSADLLFSLKNLTSDLAIKETLAILSVISADFYLDPELETSDIKEFITQAKNGAKESLLFSVSEDGLELELV